MLAAIPGIGEVRGERTLNGADGLASTSPRSRLVDARNIQFFTAIVDLPIGRVGELQREIQHRLFIRRLRTFAAELPDLLYIAFGPGHKNHADIGQLAPAETLIQQAYLAQGLFQIGDGIVLQLAGILRGLNLTGKIFLFRFFY